MVKARTQTKVPDTMGEYLGKIFASACAAPACDAHVLKQIDLVTIPELRRALWRGADVGTRDKAGIALEMILHGGSLVQQCLVHAFNAFKSETTRSNFG